MGQAHRAALLQPGPALRRFVVYSITCDPALRAQRDYYLHPDEPRVVNRATTSTPRELSFHPEALARAAFAIDARVELLRRKGRRGRAARHESVRSLP